MKKTEDIIRSEILMVVRDFEGQQKFLEMLHEFRLDYSRNFKKVFEEMIANGEIQRDDRGKIYLGTGRSS